MDLIYPWKTAVGYQTHEEYQAQLVAVMNINDENGHVGVLDNLYEYTKGDARIMTLCRLASEKCLGNLDAEYGQIMMFSYDCFAHFHFILQGYFGGGAWVDETAVDSAYQWLWEYFHTGAGAVAGAAATGKGGANSEIQI